MIQDQPKTPTAAPLSGRPRFGRIDADLADVESAIAGARDCLFSLQHPEGYWCGELEADAMLEADYIFLHTLLESGDPGRLKRACTEMMRYQNEDGSWSIYPGGPGNISLSVKCYFAAKLMGIGADDPRLAKCREWVLAHGGVTACNTFTKMYLCALGQYDYDAVPAIPPEIVLFPKWFYFNIYEISSWSRSILVPLAIMYAKKPYKKIPPEQGIDELFVGGRANSILRLRMDRKRLISWRNFFLILDRLMHWSEAVHIRPLRKLALKRAEKWMLERLEMTDGLGAIYPAMLNAIIALRCLGYSEDDPQVIRARDEFEKLGIEQPATPEMPEPTFRMTPVHVPGVGHGAGGLRAGRGRRAAQRSAHDQGRRLDAVQGGPPQGRLGREGSQDRARRLVLRVQQRVLSRHRRHGAGAAGAEQGGQSPRALSAPGRRSAPSSGSSPCSAATAAGAASTKTTPR